jgi:UDP:flavonoid glycosyltransferase YjiC (YdhE family)
VTNAAFGHLAPLVPTANALSARGHDVRIASIPSFAGVIADAGLHSMPCGVDEELELPDPEPPREDRDARLRWAVTRSWPNAARTLAPGLLEQATRWRPDVVVGESLEHAGRLVAAALDVPFVDHGCGFPLPAGWDDLAVTGLRDLYESLGARPRSPALRVELGSASVHAGDAADAELFQFVPWAADGAPLPAVGSRPRVLVTAGTVNTPGASARLHIAAAAALDVGAEVIVALGNRQAAQAGDWPAGAIVVPWVDVPATVDSCRVVLHHGGAGTSWTTLAAARPAVCVPQAGDQFRNGALLERAGVAVCIAPEDFDLTSASAAIDRALHVPVMREAAEHIAAENLALPGPDALAERIARVGLAEHARLT